MATRRWRRRGRAVSYAFQLEIVDYWTKFDERIALAPRPTAPALPLAVGRSRLAGGGQHSNRAARRTLRERHLHRDRGHADGGGAGNEPICSAGSGRGDHVLADADGERRRK